MGSTRKPNSILLEEAVHVTPLKSLKKACFMALSSKLWDQFLDPVPGSTCTECIPTRISGLQAYSMFSKQCNTVPWRFGALQPLASLICNNQVAKAHYKQAKEACQRILWKRLIENCQSSSMYLLVLDVPPFFTVPDMQPSP